MKKWTLCLLSIALLALVAAPAAEAVTACECCEHQDPNNVCGTTCSGEFVTMRCWQWEANGCGGPIEWAPTDPLEAFLLSLAEEAEPVEPIQTDAR